ncbi:MAG TPA: phosphate acyltransferase PlsX [Mycobacteriales bacterium]|nr:phosphate acyltransferase PlsX [Mycobacteriales bacterium]
MKVALDLLGGDRAPGSVVDGALLVAAARPDIEVVLVGPPDVAADLLAGRRAAGRFEVVAASQVVTMDEDPARAVRAKRDATVRVAARLVRDGLVDATVSVGSTGAAVAAAVFTLGRLPGMTRPALAVVVPASAGPVVLLDAGAGTRATADLLAQFALAGAAVARTRLGIEHPRVGLLSIGEEAGRGDDIRREARVMLAELPINFVGNVEGHDIALGDRADVVVTDGFTGNVVVKSLEGAIRMVGGALASAFTADDERRAAAQTLTPAFAEVAERLDPERTGGGLLVGVDGVVVVGHGGASPTAVAHCVYAAAQTVTDGLVPQIGDALAAMVVVRRNRAGLEVASP